MALDEVAGEGLAGSHGRLEVDLRPRLERPEVGACDRFRDDVELERTVVDSGDGQAATGDGDRVGWRRLGRRVRGLEAKANAAAFLDRGDDAAALADDPGEHGESVAPLPSAIVTLSAQIVTDTCEIPAYDR